MFTMENPSLFDAYGRWPACECLVVTANQAFNKKVFEHLIDADGFLDEHKQKSTRTIEIHQYTLVPQPVLAEYRHISKRNAQSIPFSPLIRMDF